MDLLIYLSYDFKNNKIVGIKKKNIGNIESFLCLIISIGKTVTKKNTIFIEQEPMNEYPCINTSYDEKKFPGINHGKFSSLPLKYSKIDNIMILLQVIEE